MSPRIVRQACVHQRRSMPHVNLTRNDDRRCVSSARRPSDREAPPDLQLSREDFDELAEVFRILERWRKEAGT
jgi:hypothetical protein